MNVPNSAFKTCSCGFHNIEENHHSLQKKLFRLEYSEGKASQSELDTLLWLMG
jgi:hypothetical protein